MVKLFLQDEFIKVELEESPEGLLFAHIKVYQWSPSVFKYIKTVWDEVQIEAWIEGHDYIACLSQNKKFIHMLDRELEADGHIHSFPFYIKELKDYGSNSTDSPSGSLIGIHKEGS